MSLAQAAALAAAPTAVTDARGARIRTVAVHLTGFAPGCEGLAIDNRKRWAVLYGVSPQRALRATLKRLNRAPQAVRIVPGPAAGDVDILAAPTVHTLGKAEADDLVPMATVWDGVTLAELTDAQAALIADGWQPTETTRHPGQQSGAAASAEPGPTS